MATRTFRGATDSNWGTAGNWAEGAVPLATDDVVFDATSPNCTVNASNRVAKTITFSAYTNTITMSYDITASGNVTLGSSMGIAGSGRLVVNATATLTSNAKAWSNELKISGTFTVTLADNWNVDGTLTLSPSGGTLTINGNNIYASGSYTKEGTSGVIGTTTIILDGTGTWSNVTTGATGNNITINTAGTITISGVVRCYNTCVITYIAGTIVATNSTLNLGQGVTLNTSGMTWNNVTYYFSAHSSATLTSDCNMSGNFTIGNGGYNHTLDGVYNYNVGGNLTINGTSNNVGTSSIVLNGSGTWSHASTAYIRNSITINTAGTIVLSGNIYCGNLTYTTGTVTVVGSTLNIVGNATLNLNDLVLNNFNILPISAAVYTISLASNFTINGLFSTSGYLYFNQVLNSTQAGTQRTITLPFTATQDIGMVSATDIISNGQTIWCFRGVLSNTTNWKVLANPQTIANVF